MYQDTIAAISTPLGEGEIGIVRLSGQDACSIATRLFDKKLSDRRLIYGHIIDPGICEVADEVLVVGNKCDLPSFSREDEGEKMRGCEGAHLLTFNTFTPSFLLPWPVVSTSALTGEGMNRLEERMADIRGRAPITHNL